MSILITGGTGWVGTGLAHRLVERGEDLILFDIAPQIERVADIKNNVKVVQGDQTVWPEVLNVVKENNVEGVFHLGNIPSSKNYANPWAVYEGNVAGIMNVLEAARLFGVKRVVFTSSIMSYGLGIPTETITDETLQRPASVYGVTKVYGELIGRSYRKRFDLDFRCIRYPNIFGPSVRISKKLQYIAWMIQSAALGRPAECPVSEDTKLPVLYYEDAMRATQMLYDAPKEQIETVCYNVVGVFPSLTAKEVELAIKKFIPEAKFTYKPDPWVMDYYRSINNIDDSRAREEWGWKPLYADFEKIVADFIKEVRTKPEYYSLALTDT
jgi:nucleoside-diphosphate-sugar epimerase